MSIGYEKFNCPLLAHFEQPFIHLYTKRSMQPFVLDAKNVSPSGWIAIAQIVFKPNALEH